MGHDETDKADGATNGDHDAGEQRGGGQQGPAQARNVYAQCRGGCVAEGEGVECTAGYENDRDAEA
ncbi:hypothetical protein D3C87_1907050 [compost metagenome]